VLPPVLPAVSKIGHPPAGEKGDLLATAGSATVRYAPARPVPRVFEWQRKIA
jgi:hypothetical protein